MTKPINEQQANAIFDILVEHCGATELLRENFVYDQIQGCREFRFQGSLGFGGKFYNDHDWRVSCYPEDDTKERRAMIDAANQKLSVLVAA